jgi:hypothetical protein
MTLARDADRAAEKATAVAVHIERTGRDGRTAVARMRDHMAGQPGAQRLDGGRGGGTISDPTGTAAARAADGGVDPARRDYNDLLHHVAEIDRHAEAAIRILAAYPDSRAPSAYERAIVNATNLPHCESCARIDGAVEGIPWFVEPMLNGAGNPWKTTVGERLAVALWLCRWCTTHVGTRGCLPSEKELVYRRDHGDTSKVPCRHPMLEEASAS